MNIDTLHEYAIRLKKLGLLQIAGDIDYLIAWLKSPEFNNGFHLPPHPAGENTYDEHSHCCPIPFIPCRTALKRFVNNCEVLNLIGSAKDIITELLSEYTSDLEQTAIQAYIDYTDNLINIFSDEGSDTPTPTLPEVFTSGYFGGTNELKFTISGSTYTFDHGVTTLVYNINTGDYEDYDSTKSYTVIKCVNYQGETIIRTGITVKSNNDKIYMKNESGSSISVARVKLAVSSSDVEVVTVYNASNEAFNAFKYILNNIVYYYVLDQVQVNWTNDLSSINYLLEPITYTLSFTNTTYPKFEVSLPQAITENAGTEINLPSVSGSFEDEGYIYTPCAWSIGEFGSKFILNNNINANLVWKSEEKQPSFVSDRFIDVTSKVLALNPTPNYTPNGSFWINNLARMPLSAYTTDTTQDYDFLTWGYDDFVSSSVNQSEIPTIIWLNAEWQYAPDAEVIESLGLTNEVNNAPEGSIILRVINEISGNTLGDLTFGNITRVEFIKILYADMVTYNYFGDDQHISVWETSFDYDTMLHEGLPEISFSNGGDVTDTVTVPLSDCFLVKDNKVPYCAFKTLIPANTVHINGSLYDKPLIVEYGENTGLVVYEPTLYDLQ